jgi:membrane fusion protein (multidrug efflux system)
MRDGSVAIGWRRTGIGSVLLILAVAAAGVALAGWKHASLQAKAAGGNQPEPPESIAVAIAEQRQHARTTTSIGTVVALRSITLRNELPGTVHYVRLTPGQIVEPGTVLVALDVSVEQAELRALESQAWLAQTEFSRMQRMSEQHAASQMDVDSAHSRRDVALAEVERTKAIIARKTIRAPFRARIGISDVHPGQYLNEGTLLTTLQGVDRSAYVDFTVAQQVAAALREGARVDVYSINDTSPTSAAIVAIDARVDPTTRNAVVRALIESASDAPPPGSSVRVQVPVGPPLMAVAIPASAVRKSPSGDHVFVLAQDRDGKTRAHVRQVQVEALAGDEAVIDKGLSPGERVAASGSFKLREAALVAIAPNNATASNGAASATTGGS